MPILTAAARRNAHNCAVVAFATVPCSVGLVSGVPLGALLIFCAEGFEQSAAGGQATLHTRYRGPCDNDGETEALRPGAAGGLVIFGSGCSHQQHRQGKGRQAVSKPPCRPREAVKPSAWTAWVPATQRMAAAQRSGPFFIRRRLATQPVLD